jgi:hypothetical protein
MLCRDVFPNDCYGSRVYDFSDPDPSYEAFMNCKKPFALEKNQNLAYWRVLVRGSDPGVDKFLDWLVSIHLCHFHLLLTGNRNLELPMLWNGSTYPHFSYHSTMARLLPHRWLKLTSCLSLTLMDIHLCNLTRSLELVGKI